MKNKKKLHQYTRSVIQCICFLFFPSSFVAAFAGVRYLFTQIGTGGRIEITPFVFALILLCLYTIVFGRFFCGFACAFGALGDAVHAVYLFLCRRLQKKPLRLPQKLIKRLPAVKYILLAGILLLCFLGLYDKTHGADPWEVFSMLHAGAFRWKGYGAGIVILLLLLVGMGIQERFFCRFFCPMGAVFSLLPVLPQFSLCRNQKACIPGCSACGKKCPAGIELPKEEASDSVPGCFMCQKCIDTCPKGNIHCAAFRLKGNEMIFTSVKAILLIALFFLIGG